MQDNVDPGTIKDESIPASNTEQDSSSENTGRHFGPLDLERLVELDFMRTTEAAALNACRWLGKGDPQKAHSAAVDAMRGTLDLTCVSATVIFGDGINQYPDGIVAGEKLGNWIDGSLKMELATIPIDGINLVANGLWGAMSVMVAAYSADDQHALMNVPCRHMEKIAYGPAVAAGPGQLHLNASVRDNLEIIAMKLRKRVQDLNVAVMDRQRHESLIRDIRQANASVRLIKEGEIAACIAPSLPATDIDVFMGTGGSAETVLAAAAMKCLGGDVIARMTPENEQEKLNVIEKLGEQALNDLYCSEDLARGDRIIFCATGISHGSILKGIHVDGNTAFTYSVVMRAKYRTVRKIAATHDLSVKTIRLRSEDAEAML